MVIERERMGASSFGGSVPGVPDRYRAAPGHRQSPLVHSSCPIVQTRRRLALADGATLDPVILPRDLEHVRIEKVRFGLGMRIEEHAHAWACLHWIRGGLYKERDAANSHRCGPDALLYKPPALVHENLFDEDRAWCLRLQIPWDVLPEPARESASIHVVTPLARPLLAALWAERHIADGPSELAAAALTNEIVSHIVDRDVVPESIAMRAAEAARRQIADRWNQNVSFSELADEAGVNRATLARSFHRRFGRSMGAFQRLLRVARALSMLDEGASLVVVAHETGFADQAHFTRAFKAVVGVPPARWRLRG